MREYIEKHCAISLEEGKEYLIETRLSDLVLESGVTSFMEFYQLAIKSGDGKLRDRVIDAMTTNETMWFRDAIAWEFLNDIAVKELLDKAIKGETPRVWGAAASTGQEAYSLAILLDEEAFRRGTPSIAEKVEIFSTDISPSALFLAMSGRYDVLSIKRGLSDQHRERYFKMDGRVWVIDEKLRNRVKFQRLNLQDSFNSLGKFDLVLSRYVAIYFADDFKRELYSKIASALHPNGILLLGATESIRGFSKDFEIQRYKNSTYNRLKSGS